jgi:serine protease AprX
MGDKLLVTTRTPEAKQAAIATGIEVLAEYPHSLLVEATSDQVEALDAAGLEPLPITRPPVQTASARYEFEDAKTVEGDAPLALDETRTAYYLVQLVGPMKEAWLEAIVARGGTVKATLPGYRMIVGMLPAAAEGLRAEAFVEEVTAYRPAMKISPHLRPDVPGRSLDADTLRDVGSLGTSGEPQLVQISVFEGESTEAIEAIIGAPGGGTLLSAQARTVIATVPPETLRQLAELQEVETILPYEFPTVYNDRAAGAMRVPADRDFGGITLTGRGQVIGVIDTGLDTGDEATVHPDLRGRVRIVSSPNQKPMWSSDPWPYDDGPADRDGHGTHVAGSIAGNSNAAIDAGSPIRPSGIAPAASLHFTAVAQRVNWRPDAEAHLRRRRWGMHGLPADPTPLFVAAYDAGARIHCNSWGTSNRPGGPNVEGRYDDLAKAVDKYMFEHRDALVVCTAGNNGRDGDGDLQIDSDSIGSPGTAKNVLTVGACENYRPAGSVPTPGLDATWNDPQAFKGKFAAFVGAGHVSDDPDATALFSSRGPTDEGRVKPDVVAPGTNVLSTRTQRYDRSLLDDPCAGPEPLGGDIPPPDPLAGWYCWATGTSMACPLVAGAAALVREYLVDHRGHLRDGVAPSGALLKAYIVNGAVSMNGNGIPLVPNNVNGFGRVDVSTSLASRALGNTAFSDDPSLAVASLETRMFTVQVTDPGQPLRVTLCWTDAPNGGTLQNTLYLQVQPPGGGPSINGDVTPIDHPTNPTQRVVIAAPVAGVYEVLVHGRSVTIPSAGAGAPAGIVQDFALVSSNASALSLVP